MGWVEEAMGLATAAMGLAAAAMGWVVLKSVLGLGCGAWL